MGLRDRMFELTEVAEVAEFLERYPTSAIFKAGTCHKTTQTFGYIETALNPREDIHMAFVRVVQSRPVSNHIAEITGIVHQSPQFILFVDGKPVYDVDNWNITLDVVQQALDKHLGPVCCQGNTCSSSQLSQKYPASDVTAYVKLLKDFVHGDLGAREFERRWLTTFQLDATPRSTHEFEVLNSLFGDVDAAIQQLESQQDDKLKERASHLLKALESANA